MAHKKNTDAYLRMVFTTNSPRNTIASVEDDTLYYEIVTHFWQPRLTKISKVEKGERMEAGEIQKVKGGYTGEMKSPQQV